MLIGFYIQLVYQSQKDLARAFYDVADRHKDEPDILSNCQMLARWSEELCNELQPMVEQYAKKDNSEASRLLHDFFDQKRNGGLALLQDLQDLWLIANEANISAIVLGQAAYGLRDESLISLCTKIEEKSKRQTAWLLTRIKASATQALISTEI
jgi:hypothetical protein